MKFLEHAARTLMLVEGAIARGRVLGVSEEDVRADIAAEQVRSQETPWPFDWQRVHVAVLRRADQPRRIQRKRTKGWRMPEGAVYVGRPGDWSNPFRVGHDVSVSVYPPGRGSEGWGCGIPVTPQLAVDLFRAWVLCRPAQVEEYRAELAGRDLACWCPLDQPCHADVLLEVANQLRANA